MSHPLIFARHVAWNINVGRKAIRVHPCHQKQHTYQPVSWIDHGSHCGNAFYTLQTNQPIQMAGLFPWITDGSIWFYPFCCFYCFLMLSHVIVISNPSSGQIILLRQIHHLPDIHLYIGKGDCAGCHYYQTLAAIVASNMKKVLLWPKNKFHPLLLGLETSDVQFLFPNLFVLDTLWKQLVTIFFENNVWLSNLK